MSTSLVTQASHNSSSSGHFARFVIVYEVKWTFSGCQNSRVKILVGHMEEAAAFKKLYEWQYQEAAQDFNISKR
jgi:uncharacterized protein YaiE (UPF0345 family)